MPSGPAQGAALVAIMDMGHDALPRQVQVLRVRLGDWLKQRREAQRPVFEAIEDFDQLQLWLPDVPLAIEFARSLMALSPADGAQAPLLRLGLALQTAGASTAALMTQARQLALAGAPGEWSALTAQIQGNDALLSLAWSETARPERLAYCPPLPRAHALEPKGLLPVLAVIPLQRRAGGAEFDGVGEMFADALINQLSQFSQLRVISRRSTTELRAQAMDPAALQAGLGATQVLSGRFSVGIGRSLLIEVSLRDCERGFEYWQQRYEGLVDDLVHGDLDLVGRCAGEIAQSLLQVSMQAAGQPGWSELRDFERLICASTLIYRLNEAAAARAFALLDDLQLRHPRSALLQAWQGIAHNMRVFHAVGEHQLHRQAALRALERALELDPDCPLAHAGLAHHLTAIDRQPAAGLVHCESALRSNPNEPMAWLARCLALANLDQGQPAVNCGRLAQRLSPLDPWSRMFELVVGNAHAVAGDYSQAQAMAKRVISTTPDHGPALRLLISAQQAMGYTDAAQDSVRRLLQLLPHYSVARYRLLYDAAHSAAAEREAQLLAAAGIPLH